MAPISRTEALISLSPHFPTLQEVFRRTEKHYLDYPAIVRLDHSKRTRATNIHDLLVRYARELFEGVPNVFLRKIRGLFLVEIAGMLVRFKKLSKNGRHHSSSTRQGNLFYSQQFEQVPMPGIPVATSVVAGYQEDSLEQSMSECKMVCPIGSDSLWTIDINHPFEIEENIPVVIPPKQKKTVRAKKLKRDSKADGSL